ncbi:transporter substrate-binding domain-containing protein [Chitinilyticum piscinae]|uniref:Transporter substrate-binding domain-containing protein n=1 Tax=Chitinilyticum piscinae TaxID=2866724 RepID=A0A8J7K0F3_9NEIS|nr:transporter substrate-binding domain-containing protein [Chitinilyticum piscinae]MBE9607916.1 transporter substrate-binding domain-containing protein [Chitinilyticum piscinae]
MTLAMLAGGLVHAACSRPIVVPSSPLGFSVQVQDNTVSGVYPEALRTLGRKYGCQFVFPLVPRTRAEYMVLDADEGDLLVSISRNASRDARGDFIKLTDVRPSLIFLKRKPVAARSLQDILSDPRLQGITVRGYSYGDEFNRFMDELKRQNRLSTANDLITLGKMLNADRGDFTIVAATLLVSALAESPETQALTGALVYRPLADLPAVENGAYLSRKLSEADRQTLTRLLNELRTGGVLQTELERYYSRELIEATFARSAGN